MCAILGVFTKSSLNFDLKSRFKKALSLTAHRGPDSSNELFLPNALLGFNRLSIVGAKNGAQPFRNEDSKVFLLCNGEIYNYKKLKKELKDTHNFVTDSDCETILHLYEEDPDNFVSRLKGQFSFLIFDGNRNQLILGRDRFGINPLYYFPGESKILVASEVKSLLTLDKSISNSLDPAGLKETFFLYGPTPPRTCFKNVFQVKPGHVVTFDLITFKRISSKRYWNLPGIEAVSIKEIDQKFSRLLKKAVELRLQGDNSDPGVYLSGGLDSATVASSLVALGKLPLCFSISFQDEELDESKYQNVIANSLGLSLFSLTGDAVFDLNIFQTIWHTEHPLIRTAPVPMYSLSELARARGCKYVCCGEGADEMLLGYPVFASNLCSIEDKISKHSQLEKLFKFRNVTGEELVRDQVISTAKEFSVPENSIRSKQLIEIQTKLSRYLLVQQGDRLSMSHGVEQRFPFLDENLVDFLFSLPMKWFEDNCMNKQLLRTHVRGFVPEAIRSRKKQGYLAPMNRQLYESPIISELVKRTKERKFIKDMESYFDISVVKELMEGFKKKTLSDVGTMGILFVMSTYILHQQFYGEF